jgi:transposase
MISDKIEAFLGDKGYDSDAIREELAKAEVEAVIPAKSNCKSPAPHDREKYRWRNLVERLFNKLKNCRRVEIRYDKTKESYLGFVAIASIKLWIPFVHETLDQCALIRTHAPIDEGRWTLCAKADRRVCSKRSNNDRRYRHVTGRCD